MFSKKLAKFAPVAYQNKLKTIRRKNGSCKLRITRLDEISAARKPLLVCDNKQK